MQSIQNRCPICNRLIPECHCKVRIDIIGTKISTKNKPDYIKNVDSYDFEHWCKCSKVLGLNKIQ